MIAVRHRAGRIIQAMQSSPNTWRLRDGSVLVVGKNRNYYYPDGETGQRIIVDDSQAQLMVKHAQAEDDPPVHMSTAADFEVDRAEEVVQRLRSRDRCQ